jgi:glutamyl-tRNA synthetase
VDVSKNVISKMDAEQVYTLLLDWSKEFDADFAEKLVADRELAVAVLAIGRGGKKPRKDLSVWKDAKDYMGFFYDAYLTKPEFNEKFSTETVKTALEKFLEKFDIADDAGVWFEKVKDITTEMGFTTDMKAYKANPDAFPGTVADISTFVRQAVTGKTNSPDLYTVMQILGYDRTVERIKAVIAAL